jgi:hypothetical protein
VGQVANDFNLVEAQHVVFRSSLRSSERLILLAILDCWSRKSPKPYPGVVELVRKTGLAKQTVSDAVDDLVQSGVLPEPGKLDENGKRRSGCRFVYDIEKAVNNLGRLTAPNRSTNQDGSGKKRPSSERKASHPAKEPSVKKAVVRPKGPMEGTTDEDPDSHRFDDELDTFEDLDPAKHTPETARVTAMYSVLEIPANQRRASQDR